jgi:hypothetical protein
LPTAARTLKIVASAISAACIAASCAGPDRLTVGHNRAYYGYITSGGKFGVRIGDPAESAQVVLREREQFEYRGAYDCVQLRRIVECREGQKYGVFVSDASIRNGVPVSHGFLRIEISASGEISAIVWRFYMLPSIDL